MDIYDRLKELGLSLPEAPDALGLYVPVKQVGKLLFSSGQGPLEKGKAVFTGKVGAGRTLEEGQAAARMCVMNILAQVEKHLGDLNRVKQVVKLLGFVASAPEFNDQPKVINGGSQVLIDIFGDAGRHARSALGTNELPGNITVEIEAIFEVE
jgi:enamine deaminase RidA (YjgF/YER057c/UK114 family)